MRSRTLGVRVTLGCILYPESELHRTGNNAIGALTRSGSTSLRTVRPRRRISNPRRSAGRRLHRHWSEGKPRDELVINFEEVSGGPLPCIYIPGDAAEYDYAMTAMPAEALRFVYDKYSARSSSSPAAQSAPERKLYNACHE